MHFGFGLLLAYPMRELMQRVLKLRHVWGYLLPFLMMLALSAGYESIESWVARIASPELGSAYLGTQGDEWDAQRDVDRAMTGAAIALAIIWLRERLARRARRSEGRVEMSVRRVLLGLLGGLLLLAIAAVGC